jgi:hypothetical protein
MSAQIAHDLQLEVDQEQTKTASARSRLVRLLGPLTVLAGVVWALAQPWRVTLLHPHGQGFWWLFAEPPLYVVLAGIVFQLAVARGLAAELEDER